MFRKFVARALTWPAASYSTAGISEQLRIFPGRSSSRPGSSSTPGIALVQNQTLAQNHRSFILSPYLNRMFASLPLRGASFPNRQRKLPASLKTRSYPLGPVLSTARTQKNQAEIITSKEALKSILSCHEDRNPDLAAFVDLLFDFANASRVLDKIDQQAKQMQLLVDPSLFLDFKKTLRQGNEKPLKEFFKTRFLPSLRKIFQGLAKHYGFDPLLVETNDGLLLDDDYMDFIKQGKLILDLGEDGHGPLPHIIAAFMMKEMEAEGRITSAHELYQSLAERCEYYCPDRVNYAYRFLLLLDFPNSHPLTDTQFCNPASLSNHLLFHGETLRQLALICKNHSHCLAEISRQEWEERQDKPYLSKGKAMT